MYRAPGKTITAELGHWDVHAANAGATAIGTSRPASQPVTRRGLDDAELEQGR
jgi:hypothetical protein